MKARGVVAVIAIAALLIALATFGVFILARSSIAGTDYVDLCSGQITSVNVTYAGNQSAFITLSYYPMPTYCVREAVPAGGTFSTIVYLHSTDYAYSHTVKSVGIVPPFALASMSPTPPAQIASGGNVSFNVTLQAPLTAGTYSPAATVTVV
jgi:hypothetical protein